MLKPLDFSNYVFRAHAIVNLMGGLPKPLTDNQQQTLIDLQLKQQAGRITDAQTITLGSLLEKKNTKPILNPTAKNYLQSLYKDIVFDRTKELQSKYLTKGLLVEQDNISNYNSIKGTFLLKNDQRFENAYFSGEPDVVEDDTVIDFKSSWDYTTFPLFEDEVPTIGYIYQLNVYMDLLKFDKAKLIYGLMDTPPELILNEKYRIARDTGFIDGLPEDLEAEITKRMTYPDLPNDLRIKEFDVYRDEKLLQQIKGQVLLAREYLNSLSLKLAHHLQVA